MKNQLNYNVYQDFYDAAKGFLAELTEPIIRSLIEDDVKRTVTVWDPNTYDALLGKPLRCNGSAKSAEFETQIKERLDTCPSTVNKSLWRQALLNQMHGLYEVCKGVYQVRNYDMANLTIVEGSGGIVVIDCTTAKETAEASLQLYRNYKNLGSLSIKAVILTHSHADHYGGIDGVLQGNRTIPIYAPVDFTTEAALENVIVGDAMSRRSGYQYGTFLYDGNNPPSKLSHVDSGLGKALQKGGGVGFTKPTVTVVPGTYTPQPAFISEGVVHQVPGTTIKVEFLLCPGTEAPAEMTVWLPDYRVLVAAEIATHTLHNILTPRGAEVRDTRLWWKALDKLLTRYGDRMACVCATHHWPVWDNNRCKAFLAEQRDSYKFLHDQTVRLINRGYTMLEIAQWFDDADNLPDLLKDSWHNRGYYGTISHDVRAIYQKYLGWYDMNPSNLNPLPPEKVAKRYIDLIGASTVHQILLETAKRDVVNERENHLEDYRWAAELGKHLVFSANGTDDEKKSYRQALADVYRKLGYHCEAGTWRDMYLVGAAELDKGGSISVGGSTANPAILGAMDDDILYDYIASRFLPKSAIPGSFAVDITQTDHKTTHRVEAAFGVLNFHQMSTVNEADTASPDNQVVRTFAKISLTRETFIRLILGSVSLEQAVKSSLATVSMGGAVNQQETIDYVNLLLTSIDRTKPNFNIVQP